MAGRIGIIDHDRVELSNLGRQILHSEKTVGMFKSESASLALKKFVTALFHSLLYLWTAVSTRI